MEIIKRVIRNKSGGGTNYGRIYAPKRFIGKMVLIKVLEESEIEEWEKQK